MDDEWVCLLVQEVLRARKMLVERSTHFKNEGLRMGIDLFLTDLTQRRQTQSHHTPLDICAFCVQFLPSTYQYHDDREVEDIRSHLLAGASRTNATHLTRGSNLVIQHQFTKKVHNNNISNNTASTNTPYRPASCSSTQHYQRRTSASSSSSLISSASKPPPHSYRLLTNDGARMLRIEVLKSDGNNHHHHHHLLASAADGIQDLRLQEKRQSTAIMLSARQKHEEKLRRRTLTLQRGYREAADITAKRNFLLLMQSNGATQTLYTGVCLQPPTAIVEANQGSHEFQFTKQDSMANAKIITQKSGRHFKTELFFPCIQ